MLKNYILFLFVFVLPIATIAQIQIKTGNKSSWIQDTDYELNPAIDNDEIVQGAVTLLSDYQTNVPLQQTYYRFVNKITDPVGIQAISNISAVYDPTYQKLIFHSLKILRGDQVIDKLNPVDFQVIKRELNAENYLYDGSLSAMIYLSDVRNGDIIDYDYSIIGFNPLNKGEFTDGYILCDYAPVGKINVSILSDKSLKYQLYNTTLKPEIEKTGDTWYYQWTVNNPEPFYYEEFIPTWEINMPTVYVSTYNNWKQVIDWSLELFEIDKPISAALREEITSIENDNSSEGEKIQSVLNFVQNEIRYLGLEYGISGYKPHAPNQVFDQRYGDCKDKSLLMVTMLKEMGIEAYPVLISTTMKRSLNEILPSPYVFNHCTVKVVADDGNTYFYDPTITNQGGLFDNVHFPNYEYGLTIKKGNDKLESIESKSSNLTTVKEVYDLDKVNGSGKFHVTTSYHNIEADRIREYFKNSSLSNIAKEYEAYYANKHAGIKIVKNPEIIDDFKKNVVTIKEEYIVDSIWKEIPDEPENIAVEFQASALDGVFSVLNTDSRKHSIELAYPVTKSLETIVNLPEYWNIENETVEAKNDVFNYNQKINYNKSQNQLVIKNDLKILKPIVEAKDFKDYQNDVQKINNNYSYAIFIPKDNLAGFSSEPIMAFVKIIFYFLIFIAIVGVITWLVSRNNKKKVNQV
ncbi:DUF3857 domain-containing transglutaminase family protein [Nonlabens ponticola]|uniref:DUF3857 domain-containing protein n=1 Tax=Nonlabens ponticola TaxID=2496866 RepID=A0A3S9MXM1_9FLAO|nr:DUF3857 domain-containing transglutaminase family protein [Nonlabens ponticola]AZQ43940.1 DUF3857 domain-containing protein [Nonlabens ponticola]